MLTDLETGRIPELATRLAESRNETDALFEIVRPEARYERPIPERHRIVFYIGHLEAFDWNLLSSHLNLTSVNPEFDKLFAFGIDPVDGGLPSDRPEEWPTMKRVEQYRTLVRQRLDNAIAESNDSDDLNQLLNIAIEHRLMHAETLEYMFHQLPHSSKIQPVSSEPLPALVRPQPEMIAISAGNIALGLRRGSGQFGWDNEFEQHTVHVPQFSIDKYKVTNGDFLRFVEDGGYRKQAFWSDEDWAWREEHRIERPVFWHSSTNSRDILYHGMFADIPLPGDAPVFVSHAEASAYARWAGKRLPTEAEWQRAAEGSGIPKETRVLWHSPDVASQIAGDSRFGVAGMVGTGWEWTSSEFAPFMGFEITPAYLGYSANFFDGKHFVLKGGSTRTAACMLRPTFRNWFQAHYQYVYAGFRCVSR